MEHPLPTKGITLFTDGPKVFIIIFSNPPPKTKNTLPPTSTPWEKPWTYETESEVANFESWKL